MTAESLLPVFFPLTLLNFRHAAGPVLRNMNLFNVKCEKVPKTFFVIRTTANESVITARGIRDITVRREDGNKKKT